jgi:hypothetical protein
MSNNYSVDSMPILSNDSNPMCQVAVYGKVNGRTVYIRVLLASLDAAFAADDEAGVQALLAPSMLRAAEALYQCDSSGNPTGHDILGSGPSGYGQYANVPGPWTA